MPNEKRLFMHNLLGSRLLHVTCQPCQKVKCVWVTDKSVMGWENIHVFSHCTCILACQYNKINTIQYNTK